MAGLALEENLFDPISILFKMSSDTRFERRLGREGPKQFGVRLLEPSPAVFGRFQRGERRLEFDATCVGNVFCVIEELAEQQAFASRRKHSHGVVRRFLVPAATRINHQH